MTEWNLTTTEKAEESIPTYTCVDCHQEITVRQYMRTDPNGDHHHYENWDCQCGSINELEVIKETEQNERNRKRGRNR